MGPNIDFDILIVDSLEMKNEALSKFRSKTKYFWLLYHLPRFVSDDACKFIESTIRVEVNVLDQFDLIIVPSKPFLHFCESLFPRRVTKKMVAISPGLTGISSLSYRKTNPHQIICIGTICRRKGQKRLVEALSTLLDLDWTLVLIGNQKAYPQEVSGIKRILESHKFNSRVKMLENVAEDKKVQFLSKSTIFALPTCFETFGIAIQEAMELGIPVLTGNHPVLISCVGKNNAVFVDPSSIEEIAEGLRTLLLSSSKRTGISQSALKDISKRKSWTETHSDFLSLLMEM